MFPTSGRDTLVHKVWSREAVGGDDNVMPRSDFDSTVSIKLTSASGKEVRCSALLERDPGFLQWNRISLLGNHEDYVAALGLQSSSEVRWELHNNPDWPHGELREDQHRTSGTAMVRSMGMASGVAIAPESIQKFADLRIFEYREHTTDPSWNGPRAEYWFLQRPRGWHAYPRRLRRIEGISHRSDWLRVAGSGLKFRLLSIGYPRTDRRLSRETELIQLPGVEICPQNEMAHEAFLAAADDLWFSLRILIAFRFRLYPNTLAEFRETPGEYARTWHPIAVEPREISDDHFDAPFYGAVDRFFARAAVTLARHKSHRALLHAAAFGYANSYKTFLLEGGLTSCVEAIERLVTAFEVTASLEREVVNRKEWRKISGILKKSVDTLNLGEAKASLVKRSLAYPVTLSLEERVLRMVHAQRKRWHESDLQLLAGLGNMIKARNAIVHGRLIEDINEIYVELVRARALFERLFLKFLNCTGFDCSGYPQLIIEQHEQNRSRASKPAAESGRPGEPESAV